MMKRLLFTALAIIGFATATMAQLPSYVPSNGLVGYWPFSGNANDISGNGNNGTVNGATLTNDRFGNANQAYVFDGINNNIVIPNSSSLNLSIPISISVWLKVNVYPNDGNEHYFISKFSGGPGNAMQGFHAALSDWNNSDWLFWRYRNNINSNWGGVSIPYTNLPNLGNWFNIILTSDGITDKIYVNGSLLNSSTSAIMGLNTANLLFGQDQNYSSNSRNFAGNLDDIGIWNRALNQQEITALYQGCNGVIVSSQPFNQNINLGSNAYFIASASNPSALYQWQTDFGFGFQNISNAGQYNGANNDTLMVSNATIANNNQQFRCIINDGSCKDTSNVATLTIANIGIIETNQNQFKVYPNPATNQINVQIKPDMIGSSFAITDQIGKTVMTGKLTTEKSVIELGDLSGGIYLFSIGNNAKQTFKVIKK